MKDNLSAPLKCVGLLSRYLKCHICFLEFRGQGPDCEFWHWLKIDYTINSMEVTLSPRIIWINCLVVLEDGQRIPVRLEMER